MSFYEIFSILMMLRNFELRETTLDWQEYFSQLQDTTDALPCHIHLPVCFPFIRSGQNHLARHSERGEKTRQTEEEVGRQNQGMDRPGVRQVPESSGEQGKMEKTGCKIICDAPTTLAVKGLMMNDASFPALSILTRHWTCSVVTDGSQCFSFLLLLFFSHFFAHICS